jgi:hypothetical protein
MTTTTVAQGIVPLAVETVENRRVAICPTPPAAHLYSGTWKMQRNIIARCLR